MAEAQPLDLTISMGTVGNISGLRECLESVYAEDDPDLKFEITLLSNGCTDEDLLPIEKEFPQVTLIKKECVLGWALTHNSIMACSKSRYVLILDDDTVVPKGTLPKMVRFMDEHPDVGIAACKTLNPDGSFQQVCGVYHSLKSELQYAFKLSSFWPEDLCRDAKSWQEVDWLNGSFMMVRGEVLEKVGLLDEYYYTYVIESDWCYRIREAGYKVAFVPDAEITHVGGDHSIRTKTRKYLQLIRWHVNRFYFFHKHYSEWELTLLRPIMICGAMIRVSFFLLLYFISPDRREEALPKIQAYLRVIGMSVSSMPYKMTRELKKQNDLAAAAR